MRRLEDVIEDLQRQIDNLNREVDDLKVSEHYRFALLRFVDGVPAPSTDSGWGVIYIDSADGDLKIKFGDGTVKTITADT